MTLELYKEVVLNRDLPDDQLYRGDVAVLVDFVEHPSADGEQGVILEVFNALGKTISVVVVPRSAVSPLRADHIPAVRLQQKAE